MENIFVSYCVFSYAVMFIIFAVGKGGRDGGYGGTIDSGPILLLLAPLTILLIIPIFIEELFWMAEENETWDIRKWKLPTNK